MMHYNKNDVFIVCEIVRLNPEEVKSRYSVSSVYKVNVLNSSRSNMADILFEKFYSERSGLPPEKWKGKRTERTGMNLGKIIFPCVEFKTPELQKLLAEIKKTTIYRVSKEEFNKEVKIGNIVYSLGTGGLHSRDIPMEIWSTTPYDGGTIVSASPTGEQKNANPFTIFHFDVDWQRRNLVNCGKLLREQLTKQGSDILVAIGNSKGIVKRVVIGQSAAKHLN